MRIAVAGGGGLGYLLASQISQAANAHNVVVLSRTVRPEYGHRDIQVLIVDYSSSESLSYALRGIDLVISTVSGQEQLKLIHAAGHSCVQHFVPSEFEGSLSRRPPKQAETTLTLATLQHVCRSSRMKYTIFSCGLFMERFHPNGLTHFNIGFRSGVLGPGELLVNLGSKTAEYCAKDARRRTIRVCLTSIYDVAKFVVAAIDHGPSHWPREFTLRGDRISVEDIVKTCSCVSNITLEHRILAYAELEPLVNYYLQSNETSRAISTQQMLDIANGRYDFSPASLNDLVGRSSQVDVQPMSFGQWFARIWQASLVTCI